MKEIDVLGIKIRDYSLKESLDAVKLYSDEGRVRTATCLFPRIFLDFADQHLLKEWIESLDLTVCDSYELLHGQNRSFFNLHSRSMKIHDFLELVFKYAAGSGKAIMVAAQTPDQMELVKTYVRGMQETVEIGAEYILEDYERRDRLYNEINDVVPGLLITAFPCETQAKLMLEGKKYINASLWLALPLESLKKGKEPKKMREDGLFERLRMHLRMKRYESREKP